MTTDQMKEVLEFYRAKLFQMSAPQRESEGGNRLQHVCWMCHMAEHHLEEGKIEKANRWLGFIQGVLWCEGFFTIDEMRAHNSPVETPSN